MEQSYFPIFFFMQCGQPTQTSQWIDLFLNVSHFLLSYLSRSKKARKIYSHATLKNIFTAGTFWFRATGVKLNHCLIFKCAWNLNYMKIEILIDWDRFELCLLEIEHQTSVLYLGTVFEIGIQITHRQGIYHFSLYKIKISTMWIVKR